MPKKNMKALPSTYKKMQWCNIRHDNHRAAVHCYDLLHLQQPAGLTNSLCRIPQKSNKYTDRQLPAVYHHRHDTRQTHARTTVALQQLAALHHTTPEHSMKRNTHHQHVPCTSNNSTHTCYCQPTSNHTGACGSLHAHYYNSTPDQVFT